MRAIIFLAALLGLLPPAVAQGIDRSKLMPAFFSVVLVRGYNIDGSLAYGSGVVVAPNKVVTNCHVLRQTKEPWVSHGEDAYPIVSIQADRWHDLCLATTENLPLLPATLGHAGDLKKNQEIIAIGHSSGTPTPVTSVGIVKSLYPMDHASIIRSSARFALGASGSGLFDTEGRLVGINTFKTVGRNAYFYAVPIEWLAEVEKLPPESGLRVTGTAFWEDDESIKPFFLRIAVPEIQEDWGRLSEVAALWIKAEPGNTEAWYESGLANENLGRQPEAITAYRHALAIDPLNTDALFRIGIIASANGDATQVHAIQLALMDIDKDVAEQFGTAAGCKGAC